MIILSQLSFIIVYHDIGRFNCRTGKSRILNVGSKMRKLDSIKYVESDLCILDLILDL